MFRCNQCGCSNTTNNVIVNVPNRLKSDNNNNNPGCFTVIIKCQDNNGNSNSSSVNKTKNQPTVSTDDDHHHQQVNPPNVQHVVIEQQNDQPNYQEVQPDYVTTCDISRLIENHGENIKTTNCAQDNNDKEDNADDTTIDRTPPWVEIDPLTQKKIFLISFFNFETALGCSNDKSKLILTNCTKTSLQTMHSWATTSAIQNACSWDQFSLTLTRIAQAIHRTISVHFPDGLPSITRRTMSGAFAHTYPLLQATYSRLRNEYMQSSSLLMDNDTSTTSSSIQYYGVEVGNAVGQFKGKKVFKSTFKSITLEEVFFYRYEKQERYIPASLSKVLPAREKIKPGTSAAVSINNKKRKKILSEEISDDGMNNTKVTQMIDPDHNIRFHAHY